MVSLKVTLNVQKTREGRVMWLMGLGGVLVTFLVLGVILMTFGQYAGGACGGGGESFFHGVV